MNYKKIKQLIKEKNISLKEVCRTVNISEQGLHQMIRTESMKIDVLESICKALNVPANYFFDEMEAQKNINVNGVQQIGSKNSNNNDNAALDICKKELEALKRENALKDKIIKMLEGGK